MNIIWRVVLGCYVAAVAVAMAGCQDLRFYRERETGRAFLAQVMTEDMPPEGWPQSSEAFYFFKVWLNQHGVTADEIGRARLASALRLDRQAFVDLEVRDGLPPIRIGLDHERGLQSLAFPMNNCTFQADLNSDGQIDHSDATIAKLSHETPRRAP